jgi:hypothetical protein
VNEDPTNNQLASLQWLAKARHNSIHESGVPTWVKGKHLPEETNERCLKKRKVGVCLLRQE